MTHQPDQAIRSRLHVVVLAAGQGTRMRSDLPKVLHQAAGRPLLHWVLDAVASLRPATTMVVVGHGADEVRTVLPENVQSVLQASQNGTGHAAQLAVEAQESSDDDVVVVVPGDMPLISQSTLAAMIGAHDEGTAAVVVSAMVPDPHGYGRVIRSPLDPDLIIEIVEEADTNSEQRAVREINTSVYSFSAGPLRAALQELGSSNAQGEQYLTDVIGWLTSRGQVVRGVVASPEEGMGVNTREQLRAVSEGLSNRMRPGSQPGPGPLR